MSESSIEGFDPLLNTNDVDSDEEDVFLDCEPKVYSEPNKLFSSIYKFMHLLFG